MHNPFQLKLQTHVVYMIDDLWCYAHKNDPLKFTKKDYNHYNLTADFFLLTINLPIVQFDNNHQ